MHPRLPWVAAATIWVFALATTLAVRTTASRAATNLTERVSVDSSGAEGNDSSSGVALSTDGRFVAFRSIASNLVAGDGNGQPDIFVRDRQTGITTRVSVDSSGNEGNGPSECAAISDDGRYVAFESRASNLVTGDTNGWTDVFVHDNVSGTTSRVSVDSLGNQSTPPPGFIISFTCPSISGNGNFVAFDSLASDLVAGDSDGQGDVFVHDRSTGATTRVSVSSAGVQGDGNSISPFISSDGRFVAFSSFATNLVSGDTNGRADTFLRDRSLNTTIRVNVDSSGAQALGGEQTGATVHTPSVSTDGRYVAFDSIAANLVPGDTNGLRDVFVRDVTTGTTTRVNVDSSNNQATNESARYAMSADGRYVAFLSAADNLIVGDANRGTDAFVKDRQSGATTRVSIGQNEADGGGSVGVAIGSDGHFVGFDSYAANLVTGDTNAAYDVFVRDRVLGTTPGPSSLSATPAVLRVDLSWTLPNDGGSTINVYRIYRGTSAGSATLLATTSGGVSYVDYAVSRTTTYYYQVAAINAAGEGGRSNEATAMPLPDPANAYDLKLHTLDPCRLIDTRDASGPFGGPVLAPGQKRTFTVTGRCGIPPTAKAISANLTVVGPSGAGYLTVFPGDGSLPPTSSINFLPAQIRANNGVVRLASDGSGQLNIVNGSAGTSHALLDVNGYFE